MMTETSQLHPELIRAQCASAISNLEENNTSLFDLGRASDEYIDDTTLAGRGYDAIRLQMEDYKLISTAKREANDSDILDFRALSTRVGNGIVLIGAVILRNKEAAEKADAEYKSKINIYTALMIASMTTIAGLALTTHYRNLRNDYRDLREANQVTLQLWTDMENRYNRIEAETKNLFERTSQLRSNIDGGLQAISGASTGLPDSYDSESLAAWRLRMQELRDQLAFDQTLAEIRAEHGDEAYEWVKESYDIAREMLNAWGFPVGDYDIDLLSEKLHDYQMIQAIKAVNEDPRFSHDEWKSLTTLADRETFLSSYMATLVDIFGVNIELVIDFTDMGISASGSYDRSRGDGIVWLNPNYINPDNEGWQPWKSSSTNTHKKARETVVHELRHAYQAQAILNPDTSNVSQATTAAWESNYPGLGGHYIVTGNDRADGNGTYTYSDYMNQEIEVDAFAFGELREWRSYG